jgi:MFS family permease
LYIHRYIENALAPQIAKRYLLNSEWSQIIVGGSNFGELLGALIVFLLTKCIRSPILWLRIDCLLLLITWYIPFYQTRNPTVTRAWIVALTFVPFGIGAAGDDVLLNAHLQSIFDESESDQSTISPLGSAMAFLYSSYIILYAILNPVLGRYIDRVYAQTGTIQSALIYTAGVQVSIVSVLVFLCTFIPRGAFRLNPSFDRPMR